MSPKILLLSVFVCFPVSYIAKILENSGLVLVGWFGEEYHIFETIATYSFIIASACVGLFLVYGLSLFMGLFGISGGEEKQEDLIFTKSELIQMDKEDEPVHNEHWRLCAAASEEGCSSGPVYYDYRGNLIDYRTGAPIVHDDNNDKRRVVSGEVSPMYEDLGNDQYKYIGSGV